MKNPTAENAELHSTFKIKKERDNVKKAVIYARYSCDKQTEQSIEGQLYDCYEYAKKHDITVVREYIDRAMTGKNDDRPAFRKMLWGSGNAFSCGSSTALPGTPSTAP